MPQVDINEKRGYEASVPVEKIWSKFRDGTMDSKFCIPLGENKKKEDVRIDLTSAHHILAAGAALSGFGMFRRVALATLLKFNKPEDLKFILIDPLEVSFFDFKNIDKHLVFPIITDNKKSIETLEWVYQELNRRYDVLKESKTHYIETYNENNPDKKIPIIVVMVTELGELLDFDKEKAEKIILLIATRSKCAGIHLIITTQRPTKDVITGLIFANMPTKIAFQTGSKEGSLAVLFREGAEELLGQGDMLVDNIHNANTQRLQGYYLSEEDIGELVF
jgi:S-DNA-T family DNA segregation ATPase FtsK/SpoIIIE